MDALAERLPISTTALRVLLVAFVLTWIFGPDELRAAIPIWLPFLVALGLEVAFLVSAFRPEARQRPDRAPQQLDRERYGYTGDSDELLLVHDGEEDLDPVLGRDGGRARGPHRGGTRSGRRAGDRAARDGADARDRLRRFAVGVAVIAVLALVVWFVESRTGWDSLDGDTKVAAVERFSEEAARIADKPVSIRCDESRDYVGFVQHADGVALVGGDRAYLTPERCYDLYRLAFEGEVTSSQTARAISVLAHEAWHLRGVRDEGTTECYALQSGVELGQRLGLSEDTARQMMRQQLVENRRGARRASSTSCLPSAATVARSISRAGADRSLGAARFADATAVVLTSKRDSRRSHGNAHDRTRNPLPRQGRGAGRDHRAPEDRLLDGARDGDELHRQLGQPGRVRAQEIREALAEDIQEELGHAQQFADRIEELYGVVPGCSSSARSSRTSSRPTSRPTSCT